MKTLTLVVFAISCSLSQLPGSLAVSVQAGKSKDTLRALYPSQLSSAAKECLKSDDTVGDVDVGAIDGAFKKYFYDLSTILDLDAQKAKKAGDCLFLFRNHNNNLTSCESSFEGDKSADALKKVYDNFYSEGFPSISNSKVFNCYWKQDQTPNNYGRYRRRYEALSHSGGTCAERVLGNSRDCMDFDKILKEYKTECGYLEERYYDYDHGEDRAEKAVENCFSYGQFCAIAAMPQHLRFNDQGSCVQGYIGAGGLEDMRSITNRLASHLSKWSRQSELISCALMD